MPVNWSMRIQRSLSEEKTHSNKQEIEAIKKHLKDMGFKFKSTEADHCFVQMVSVFKIEKGLEFVSQQGTLYYNPEKPLWDLLHELDHIYQLQEAKRITEKKYLPANILKIKIINGKHSVQVPPIIVDFILNEVIKNDSLKLDGDVKVFFKKKKPKLAYLSIGKSEIFISPEKLLTRKHCNSIIEFVSQWNRLKESERKELLHSFITHYDNEEMEIAAYERELGRSDKLGNVLGETQTEKLKELYFQKYVRFHGKGLKPSVLNYTWDQNNLKNLKAISHKYLESKENMGKQEENDSLEDFSPFLFFPSKVKSGNSLESPKASKELEETVEFLKPTMECSSKSMRG